MIAMLLAMQVTACSSANNGDNGGENPRTVPSNSEGTKTDKLEEVTLRIMDWSDSSKTIREEFHKQFMEKYPNIKIEYTQLTLDQFKNTILTAVKSGEAPDLFPVPSGMKLSTLVADGWFQPLDPLIDDEFKSLFMEGTFQNGTTMVDGQIYSIPENASMPHSLVFYNKKLFQEAGLDPSNPPSTYSELREAAKKITEAGNGSYYGFIEGGKQSNRWATMARDWSSLAGEGLNEASPINLATGETTYDSGAIIDVFNLMQGMMEEGSFHPKTMSISAPEARALFGQGQAAFLVQGAWCIGVWNKENPELDYGVMAPPVPDSGRSGSIAVGSPAPWVGIYAKSDHPEEAALYLKELYGGGFFQEKRAEIGDAFSVVKGVNEAHIVVPQLKQYYEIVQEFGNQIPEPSVRNPETANVFAEFKDVNPNLGALLGGYVAGAIDEIEGMLSQYSDHLGKAWNDAIQAASSKGSKVEASDFLFPNWNSLKPYTVEDYQTLQ